MGWRFFSALLFVEFQGILNLLITLIFSGGFLGGIYALLKLRPEAGQIVVTAAQGALVVSTGVIETLKEELVRLEAKIDLLEKELGTAETENRWLKARVWDLEQTTGHHSEVERTE